MRRLSVTALTSLALLFTAQAAQAAQPRIDLTGDGAPRPFELNASDPVSLPFAAATPGPVHIDIVSKGAVTVTLVRGNGKRVTQSGSGAFSLDDQVTAEDVAQGQIWDISVRAAKGSGSISGTVAVHHPAGDGNAANAELQKFSQRPKPAKPQISVPAGNAAQLLATQKAQLAQDTAARHLAEIKRTQNDLPPDVVSLLTARANLLGQRRTVDEINAQAPIRVSSVTASSLKNTVAATRVTPNVPGLSNATASPAPSTPPVNTPAPAPDMRTLSVSQGDPGTSVIIRGQNFGALCTCGGSTVSYASVHFTLPNGKEDTGGILSWTDNAIVVEVPSEWGMNQYAGQIYVKTLDGQTSAPAPFTYLPRLDVAVLEMPAITQNGPDHYAFADSTLSDDLPVAFLDAPTYGYPNADVARWSGFFGNAANDTFYNTRQLQNGWKVKSCDLGLSSGWTGVQTSDPNSANASITECRVGTSSPFVKMHWWMDGGYYVDDQFLAYGFTVTITGPVGLPY